MSNLRKSIYSHEHTFLRELFIARRKELGLSQRALAERLGVIYSLVGKIETGERRLDIFEFITYCESLELSANEVLSQLLKECHQANLTQ
ncbi:MAG: helix-turn-helix transcriptional regulator [Moraxellaceae bacterium]|nr:helix-turn-helix transcriptional regulator [Moraxellaceae bacterium]